MRTKIAVDRVDKSYASDKGRLKVLEGITFTVGDGEIVAIVGPSGCGKSTLLDILAGVDRPDRGSVTVDGAELTQPSPAGILMAQHGSVFPWLTVQENVMFGLEGQVGSASGSGAGGSWGQGPEPTLPAVLPAVP